MSSLRSPTEKILAIDKKPNPLKLISYISRLFFQNFGTLYFMTILLHPRICFRSCLEIFCFKSSGFLILDAIYFLNDDKMLVLEFGTKNLTYERALHNFFIISKKFISDNIRKVGNEIIT